MSPSEMHPRRALLIDDLAPARAWLRVALHEAFGSIELREAGSVAEALRQLQDFQPDLALVDLHLARGSTGFSVAVRLSDFDVPCLFVTGRAPDFPMPDLALGCLLKPFTAEDVHRSLSMAEDVMRGRETLRQKVPPNLLIYDGMDEPAPRAANHPPPGFIPSKRSLRTRFEHWISGTQM